jgi:hypothetical protein
MKYDYSIIDEHPHFVMVTGWKAWLGFFALLKASKVDSIPEIIQTCETLLLTHSLPLLPEAV